MSTLIEVRDASGVLIARCDSTCYNAKGSDCRCCCNGQNHGVGFDQALANTQKEAKAMLEKFLDDRALKDEEVQIKTNLSDPFKELFRS